MEFNLELMLKVRERVLAEPGRVNMRNWTKPRRLLGMIPCGTVCCIMGHAAEISGGRAPHDIQQRNGTWKAPANQAGATLLGLSMHDAEDLFHFHDDDRDTPYNDLRDRLLLHKPGSRQYANVVAEAIDRCIALHTTTPVAAPPEPTIESICAVLESIERNG